MGQRPRHRRLRRVIELDHPRAPAGLLPQLERRLQKVAAQPARRIQTGQRFDREQAFEPAVADQAAHERAVLLLDPSLVVLAVRSRARHLEPLLAQGTLALSLVVSPSSKVKPSGSDLTLDTLF